MKKMFLLSCLLLSSNLSAKEFLIEVKDFKNFNGAKVLKKFEALNKKYIVLEADYLPQNDQFLKIADNNDIYLLNTNSYLPTVKDLNKQWGLINEGKNEPITPDRMSPVSSIAGTDINIKNIWQDNPGSTDIRIAVVDTGLDIGHPELKDNLWVNKSELFGKPGIDDDGNGYIDDVHGYDFTGKEDSIPQDENGHGTHCAGIIAASHEKGRVAGVMKKASIMGIRILDKKGAGKLDQAVKGFAYAIKNNVHIISNSWGSRGHNEILEDLIKEATKKGIIVIAAAGNSRYNDNDLSATYPANYPNVISVSSINARARHAAYSSYGKNSVHIGAPGTNILSTHTLKKGFKYRVMSGTSMAAPFISGIVGLYLAKYGVNQDPTMIKNKLISTATKLDHVTDMNQANGLVNTEEFLK